MDKKEKVIRGKAIMNLQSHKGWRYLKEDLDNIKNGAIKTMLNIQTSDKKRLEAIGKINAIDRYLGEDNILDRWERQADNILKNQQ